MKENCNVSSGLTNKVTQKQLNNVPSSKSNSDHFNYCPTPFESRLD